MYRVSVKAIKDCPWDGKHYKAGQAFTMDVKSLDEVPVYNPNPGKDEKTGRPLRPIGHLEILRYEELTSTQVQTERAKAEADKKLADDAEAKALFERAKKLGIKGLHPKIGLDKLRQLVSAEELKLTPLPEKS